METERMKMMKKQEFTFEDFIACRKQLENEGMDYTQEKGLIVFSSEEYGVFRYQHVDDWFSELKEKHPDIAFLYLDTFGLPDRVLSESVHVILQRDGRLYNVSAKMKSRDGVNPPRFEYVEIDESLILKYKQTSQDYHYHLHHELSRCLQEKGIQNVDVVHGCSFLNKERQDEKYELYFYHRNQLMVAEINIEPPTTKVTGFEVHSSNFVLS